MRWNHLWLFYTHWIFIRVISVINNDISCNTLLRNISRDCCHCLERGLLPLNRLGFISIAFISSDNPLIPVHCSQILILLQPTELCGGWGWPTIVSVLSHYRIISSGGCSDENWRCHTWGQLCSFRVKDLAAMYATRKLNQQHHQCIKSWHFLQNFCKKCNSQIGQNHFLDFFQGLFATVEIGCFLYE